MEVEQGTFVDSVDTSGSGTLWAVYPRKSMEAASRMLDVGAELIFALGVGRDRSEEEQGKEEVGVREFHKCGGESRAGLHWPSLRECSSE